jgi:hypothetical protein
MLKLLKLQGNLKVAQTLAIAGLAVAQAATLTACSKKRAMLAKKPTPSTAPDTGSLAPSAPGTTEQDSKKTPPKGEAPAAGAGASAGTPASGNPTAAASASGAGSAAPGNGSGTGSALGSNTGTPAATSGSTGASAGTTTPATPPKSETPAAASAATPTQAAAPAASQSEFVNSLQWVTLKVLGDSVTVSFGNGTADATETHARLTGPLSAVTAKGGASLAAESKDTPGNPTVHVACEDAACSRATLKIGNDKGSATAQLFVSQPKNASLRKAGNHLAGVQAAISEVIESKDAKHSLVIAQVAGGAIFFKFESVLADKSKTAADREITVSGKMNVKDTRISIAHTGGPLGGPSETQTEKLEGLASSVADGIVVDLNGTNDRIQSISVGDF